MVFGLFMAIMDVQIVTSSLTQIQGGLSASADEISWVQTAYLIADVVMVPLSGTLSRLLSTRVLFVTAALGFTAASALCATATSLQQMIFYRALQGFSGGAITPSVFPVVYTKFRAPQLTTVMVLISLILNLSSTLGPTIGGYLTDTFSWHWLFLVNIVPGIAVSIVVWLVIDIDKPDPSLLRRFDLSGLVLMALFLGCLQYALEEGPRWDWLDDHTIRAAVIVSGVAGALFFFRVLTYRQPIVDLRTFVNRNFAVGSFYTFVVGTGLYGATYLVPLFLAEVRGFNSLQIGETVVVTGLAQMAMSPFTTFIARKLDLRIMLAIGMATFAVAMYLTAGLTNQASFGELLLPQALRGCALMFCYLPANLLALGTIAARQAQERRRALQFDPRSRWGDRACRHRHRLEPAPAIPLEPADRRHQFGAPGGAAFSRHANQPVQRPLARRRPPCGDEGARQHRPARGPGDELQRRADAAGGLLRDRPCVDAIGQKPANGADRRSPLKSWPPDAIDGARTRRGSRRAISLPLGMIFQVP